MIQEQYACAYELCQKSDPIEVIPGHRTKQYHDDTCRQAQHRLRKEREQQAKLENLSSYVTKFHDPTLRTLLERTLREQGAPALLRLAVAIENECRYVQANDEMQQRVAYLEIKLSHYRSIVDLEDRAKIEQQFMAVGRLLNYRALDTFHVGAGIQSWEDYRSLVDELTLADIIVYARTLFDEEPAAHQQEMAQSEKTLLGSALIKIQAYLHVHPGSSIPVQRGRTTLRITALRDDCVGSAIGQGIVSLGELELEQMHLWIAEKTGMSPEQPATLEHDENQTLRRRIQELEVERADWIAWKDVQITGHSTLSAMQHYLQEHLEAVIPVCRNGVTIHIMALGNDAVAVTEDHGMVRLNDDELEEGRTWVAKKCGYPVLATRLAIGVSREQGQQLRQIERELADAQASARAAQMELSKYLPAPRELLESTLRHWSTKTRILFQDKTLAGDDLDAFLHASSDHRLQEYIASSRRCYFIDKYHQQRMRVVANAIEMGETFLYKGDSELELTGIDAKGNATLANGSHVWLWIDDMRQYWAYCVVNKGQDHVGGNADVAPLQQYLYDHPGQSIPVQRGTHEHQIVFVDDDALAVTETQGFFPLYEDELTQAYRWIQGNRDRKSA